MIVRSFIFENNDETGDDGWRPSWLAGADPINGMGLAHDMLEHRLRDDGSVNHELIAFGATWWIRSLSGWFSYNRPYTSAEYQLYASFPNVFEQVVWGDDKLRDPGPTRALDCDLTETAFVEIAEKGIQCVIDEYSESFEQAAEFGDEILPADASSWIVGWLRTGYRWADRRYGGEGSCDSTAETFDAITSLAQTVPAGDSVYGDRLVIHADPVGASVFANLYRGRRLIDRFAA